MRINSKQLSILLVGLLGLTSLSQGQLRITRTDQLPVGSSRLWAHPRFSPNGRLVYFTDEQGNGIWEYSIRGRSTRRITSDPASGLGYSISSDGKSLLYRRTVPGPIRGSRKQDVVLVNLSKRSISVLTSAPEVSVPTFADNTPVYSVRSETRGLSKTSAKSAITVLGIEDTKIALSVRGKKVTLDPLGQGSYIWPALSPDKQLLVAYEMDRGAFVCDLAGNVISTLGKRDAPSWTRSGRWIVYMEDKDDGHRLLSSDLYAVTRDGSATVQLTSTADVLELEPSCSPAENKFICNTSDGKLLIFEYEEQR